jgi:hypothetical protein
MPPRVMLPNIASVSMDCTCQSLADFVWTFNSTTFFPPTCSLLLLLLPIIPGDVGQLAVSRYVNPFIHAPVNCCLGELYPPLCSQAKWHVGVVLAILHDGLVAFMVCLYDRQRLWFYLTLPSGYRDFHGFYSDVMCCGHCCQCGPLIYNSLPS